MNDSPFDAVTLESTIILVELMGSGRLESHLLAQRFRERASNLDVTVAFMTALGAVRHEDRFVVVDEQFAEMHAALSIGETAFKRHVLQTVLDSDTSYGQTMRRLVSAFEMHAGLVRVRPSDIPAASYAIRNVLMEAGALRFYAERNEYGIEDWFLGRFVRARYGRGITPSALRTIHDAQNDLGLAAEKAVLQYECQVVDPRDTGDVFHVSQYNVSAGFDIASVRRRGDGELEHKQLLMIEVKAVSPADWHFTLSSNEIDVARQNGTHYAVYLIPIRNGRPVVSDMQVVLDPVRTLERDGRWRIERDGWYVSRRRGAAGSREERLTDSQDNAA